MPIYEYRRPDGTTFEILQSFADEALTKDPETGVEVQRVLHAPAVHFKGKGFYNTDYGTRKRQRETAAETAAATDGSGDSSTQSDGGSEKATDSSGSSSEKSEKVPAGKGEKPTPTKPTPAKKTKSLQAS
jgi:putative FmdB family regulatory protein